MPDQSSKRPGLLDEVDRARFIARRAPEWGEQAAELLWKRQQDLRLLAVAVSLTFIIAVLTAWVLAAIAIVLGGIVSLLLAMRVHRLRKMAVDLRG